MTCSVAYGEHTDLIAEANYLRHFCKKLTTEGDDYLISKCVILLGEERRGNKHMDLPNGTEIRDPIYDFIRINEFEREVIDSPHFQRLRRIQQLALTSMAYPGAVHTRFEHSLGTMHLAGLMFEAICKDKNSYKIMTGRPLEYDKESLKRDKQLVRITALLHDVGHAPFSHAAEGLMPSNDEGERFTHVNYTVAVINGPLKHVINDSPFNEFGIRAEQVAELYEGLGERAFWKVILNSQLDADRGDFLLRDSHHIGVKYGIYDYPRLLNTLTLGIEPEPEGGLPMLGVKKEGCRIAESLLIARYLFYTQVVFHKTRRAYDYHLAKAMKEVLPNKGLPPPIKIEKYLAYDDLSVLDKIKDKKDCCEHCKAIVERKHARSIYSREIRNKVDVQRFERKKKKLTQKKIEFYQDEVDESWYEPKDSIMIFIGEREDMKAKPLSELSIIAKNLKYFKKWRLYVALEDKPRAKNAIR